MRAARSLATIATAALVATLAVTTAPAPAAEAASAAIVQPAAAPPTTVERIAGADRFATSVAISQQHDWEGDVVFIASGTTFADALAAAPVAAAERGPLLLTTRDALPASVLAEIRRLAPSEIVVVGSEASVGSAVEATLRAELADPRALVRLGGADRVRTAMLLHARLLETGPVEDVWLVPGGNFADALAAASVAGIEHAAIVPSWHGGSREDRARWFEVIEPAVTGANLHIVGQSLPDGDWEVMRDVIRSTKGYAGGNRYSTAASIADAFHAGPAESGRMLLASGQQFPDALSGAVLAAVERIPLLLTPAGCHPTVTDRLADERDQRGVTRIIGLGGAPSVSDAALSLASCRQPTATQITAGNDYGTFPTMRFVGSGPAAIPLDAPIGVGLLAATAVDGGAVRIQGVDGDGQPTGDLLERSGPYQGTTALGTYGDGTTSLYVDVAGRWVVEVRDATHAPDYFGGQGREHSDVVFVLSRELRVTVQQGYGDDPASAARLSPEEFEVLPIATSEYGEQIRVAARELLLLEGDWQTSCWNLEYC